MKENIDRVLKISNQLDSGVEGLIFNGASELNILYQKANGFVAFEGALAVFPSGTVKNADIKKLNNFMDWKAEYNVEELTFFARDIFGHLYASNLSKFYKMRPLLFVFDYMTGEK